MALQSKKDTSVAVFSFSDEIIQLYDSTAVRNVNEAIAVLFHAFLLDRGFSPKDVPHTDIYKSMPKDWNANGIFRMKYLHNCCSSYTCSVTCVPLGNNASVHGIICNSVCSESINLKMNISKYLKQKKDLSNVCEVFSNIDELSRHFQDNFCLPLLNLLHEIAGVRQLFGFPGLYDDLKILILMLLPVESIVAMSSVNKNLHILGNLPFLWKYLFKRDYGKDGVPEIETSSKTDWKEMYKKEYVKKSRRPQQRNFIFPYHLLPPRLHLDRHYPRFLDPDSDFDLGIDFDSPFLGSPYFPPFYDPAVPRFFNQPVLPLTPFKQPQLPLHFMRM